MKVLKKFALLSLALGAVLACKPTSPDGDGDEKRTPTLNAKTDSSYEKYITRSPDITKTTLDIGIINNIVDNNGNSDGKDGKIWMLGVTAVKKDGELKVNPMEFGAGTANILFNWFDGEFLMGELDAPLPLGIPVVMAVMEFKPNDPGVKYNPTMGAETTSIDVIYNKLFDNDDGKGANKAGNLYNASAWSSLNYKAGDDVDLVVYIYVMEEDVAWYIQKGMDQLLDPNGDGSMDIPAILKEATLDHVIELQRIPVILK